MSNVTLIESVRILLRRLTDSSCERWSVEDLPATLNAFASALGDAGASIAESGDDGGMAAEVQELLDNPRTGWGNFPRRVEARKLIEDRLETLVLDVVEFEKIWRRQGADAALAGFASRAHETWLPALREMRRLHSVLERPPPYGCVSAPPAWFSRVEVGSRQEGQVLVALDSDLDRALALARDIHEPGYRCSSLTAVARRIEDDETMTAIVDEAFEAAAELDHPNRHVVVAGAPPNLLIKRGRDPEALRRCRELMEAVVAEPSPVRRAHALERLLWSLRNTADPTVRASFFRVILGPYAAAVFQPLASGKRNRRGESSLVGVIPLIFWVDPAEAERLAREIRGEATRERALGVLAELREQAD